MNTKGTYGMNRPDQGMQEALARMQLEMSELKIHRDEAQQNGVPALIRLVDIAQRDTGQSRKVAHFLLGLYNGPVFPFDMTELRCLDWVIFQDCMSVLEMDYFTVKEVHQYVVNGDIIFRRMAEPYCK